MTIGIYTIINLITDDSYIGSSINIEGRWRAHRYYLRHNIHQNEYLQRAWNKYTENSFLFLILEKCKEDNLLDREQYYIDNSKNIYNIMYYVERKDKNFSKETKIKMKKSKEKYWKKINNKCVICKTPCDRNKYCSKHSKKCKDCENRIPKNKSLCKKCLTKRNIIYCESCEKRTERRGSNQKYCEKCSDIERRKRQKLTMRKRRKK